MNKKREKVYREALNLWGVDLQLTMVQEECAELIKAVSKLRRGNERGVEKVTQEIADVLIMIEQAMVLLDNESEVYVKVDEKVERLKQRIKEGRINKK